MKGRVMVDPGGFRGDSALKDRLIPARRFAGFLPPR